MKKSEYRKNRREAWEQVIARSYPSYESVETLVARDEEACDAAGVAWDPEEPKRVSLPDFLTVVKTGQNCGRLAYFATRNAIADLTLDELDEVKRRCDAWPELERIIAERTAGSDLHRFAAKLDRIRLILRGS